MKRAASILMAVIAVALLGGAVVGSRAAVAATPTTRFAGTPCTVRVPDGQGANIHCGTVTVPEDRSKPNGRSIKLAVAVLKATGARPQTDPVLYLSGGPGGPSLDGEMQNWDADFAAPLQKDHDLVFYDQRGTGTSTPGLFCPFNPTPEESIRQRAPGVLRLPSIVPARIIDCHDQLVSQGIDLTAYTSAASALDIVDVMTALGYDQWNLYGVSYGTRLALTSIRDTPHHIRSVVLDSTVPLQANLAAEVSRDIERAFDTLFRGCRLDRGCNGAFPNFESDYFDFVARANANPIVVTVPGPDGKLTPVPVTGNDIIYGTFIALYQTSIIPTLPNIIERLAHGDIVLLTLVVEQLQGAFPGFADGMELSVDCHDEDAFLTQSQIDAGTFGVRPEILAANIGINNAEALAFDKALCAAWGAKTPNAIENEPVRGNIPTLVLAGEYDPITPPRWGRLAASTLSNSRFYEFPANGHGVIYGHHECASIVVTSFFASLATAPDSACIAQIPPPAFELPGPEAVSVSPAPAPAPPPIPAPVAPVILAPDTGTGPSSGGDAGMFRVLVLALMAGGYAAVVTGLKTRRRRPGGEG